MDRFRFASLILAAIVAFGQPPAADAKMNGTLDEFERYLRTLPGANFKRVPDENHPGILYAGRLSEFSTIVRVHTEDGRIVRQRVEVALPTEKRDDFALVILSRFVAEFSGHPGEIRGIMDQMRSLRGGILNSGMRSMSATYRGAKLTLTLDSSPNEIHPHPNKGTWGLLFWSAETERITRKPRS